MGGAGCGGNRGKALERWRKVCYNGLKNKFRCGGTEDLAIMEDFFSRTELLIGKSGRDRLAGSRVAIFGLGGVGGYCTEALVRAGVGAVDLIDHDRVSESNLNRQIYALRSTVGRYKTEVARGRIADINPDCVVRTFETFYLPETAGEFDFRLYDYVVDAIDTVAGKIALIENAVRCGTPIISSMGAGNKFDPTMFEISYLENTSVCPLARVMRRELKKRGIGHIKVVYSKEEPKRAEEENLSEGGKPIPGSLSFVPSVMGLILAGEVVKDLLGSGNDHS